MEFMILDSLLWYAAAAVGVLIGNMLGCIMYVELRYWYRLHLVRKYGDPELCCCGTLISEHTYADNHGPVSEVEHFLRLATEERRY